MNKTWKSYDYDKYEAVHPMDVSENYSSSGTEVKTREANKKKDQIKLSIILS